MTVPDPKTDRCRSSGSAQKLQGVCRPQFFKGRFTFGNGEGRHPHTQAIFFKGVPHRGREFPEKGFRLIVTGAGARFWLACAVSSLSGGLGFKLLLWLFLSGRYAETTKKPIP